MKILGELQMQDGERISGARMRSSYSVEPEG